MRVATLRIERFCGIRRFDPDGDDLALPIGENNTGRTGGDRRPVGAVSGTLACAGLLSAYDLIAYRAPVNQPVIPAKAGIHFNRKFLIRG